MSVEAITDTLGQDLSLILPFAHVVSGCDIVSSMFGKGKTKALNMLKDSKHLRCLSSIFD